MQLVSDREVVRHLVELLKLERDRPPELEDGGAAAREWARRIRELEAWLRDGAPEVWAVWSAGTPARNRAVGRNLPLAALVAGMSRPGSGPRWRDSCASAPSETVEVGPGPDEAPRIARERGFSGRFRPSPPCSRA